MTITYEPPTPTWDRLSDRAPHDWFSRAARFPCDRMGFRQIRGFEVFPLAHKFVDSPDDLGCDCRRLPGLRTWTGIQHVADGTYAFTRPGNHHGGD